MDKGIIGLKKRFLKKKHKEFSALAARVHQRVCGFDKIKGVSGKVPQENQRSGTGNQRITQRCSLGIYPFQNILFQIPLALLQILLPNPTPHTLQLSRMNQSVHVPWLD